MEGMTSKNKGYLENLFGKGKDRDPKEMGISQRVRSLENGGLTRKKEPKPLQKSKNPARIISPIKKLKFLIFQN
jgi:hypothetical protein